jgi:hypothetical protein
MCIPAQNASFVARAQKNPFANAMEFKVATIFPGQKCMVILRLKEVNLRELHTAVKDVLSNGHKLYHLAFAESSVDLQWGRVIFSEIYTFSLANCGLILVYRRRGERYNSLYVLTSKHCDRVSVHCWGWISHEEL